MPTTVGAEAARGRRRLQVAGIDNAASEAMWLLAHVLACSVSDLRLRPDAPVTAAAAAAYGGLLQRRESREPLQYILGTQEFMGMMFQVTPAVLIPRPETELLIRLAAALIRSQFPQTAALRLAEIGTGSGCATVGLAALLPGAKLTATDISPAALAVAAANARRLGYADQIEFRSGDLYNALPPRPALHGIVSNPPYIGALELPDLMPEVSGHEPRAALSPGVNPLATVFRLIDGAPACLLPGGVLALEVGANQCEAVCDRMGAHGFSAVIHQDLSGRPRYVIGVATDTSDRPAG